MTVGARRAAHRLAWSLIVLFIVVIAIGAANLLFTNSQVGKVQKLARNQAAIIARQQQQIQADCGFYRDLASLPLANLPNGHPSELGVKIVSDSRGSWVKRGCRGKLPSPDPSFVAGAKFYHLPAN